MFKCPSCGLEANREGKCPKCKHKPKLEEICPSCGEADSNCHC
jgi:hypothetical protein